MKSQPFRATLDNSPAQRKKQKPLSVMRLPQTYTESWKPNWGLRASLCLLVPSSPPCPSQGCRPVSSTKTPKCAFYTSGLDSGCFFSLFLLFMLGRCLLGQVVKSPNLR